MVVVGGCWSFCNFWRLRWVDVDGLMMVLGCCGWL